MNWLEPVFWLIFLLLFYTYLGYGIVIFGLVIFKRFFTKKTKISSSDYPHVTILIAAYNEEEFIHSKIENTLLLNYPADKIEIIIVTDGSDDGTAEIVNEYPNIIHLHQPERMGKIAAVDRAMNKVNSEIVVFTDANALLNEDSIVNLVRHFQDEKVGAVAGEKRISIGQSDQASAAGEGIYWKYESKLKQWDSEFNTVVGAAGELFAIRKALYEHVPKDTLIEDFYLTLKIAQNGFKIAYEPGAYAMEEPTASANEELKRKIRIAAGGIQSIIRLMPLMNVIKYGWLTFQYFSHRVLRWTLAPLSLPVFFVLNIVLTLKPYSDFYFVILVLQLIFYFLALIGFVLEKKKIKFKIFFIPFYFCLMNYAVFAGFWNLITGRQTVIWEKSERRKA